MNAQPSITSTTTINTLTTGYFNVKQNAEVLTNTIITILFTIMVATKGYYFTCRVNGLVVEYLPEMEESNRFSLKLVPGDEIEIAIHRDDNQKYFKSLTFSADELGVHATCAPAGIRYTAKSESKTKKDIHSRNRPAA